MNAILSSRGQELWFIGIDAKAKQFIDICGMINPEVLEDINGKGFQDSDAGYRADAQNFLPLRESKADIFLLNTVHFSARPAELEPLVVHELAHLLEQIGEMPALEGNDEANASAIIQSLKSNILHLHPRVWALHLAAGGRLLLSKKLTPHKTIRAFLEAAIPQCDRHDDIRAQKGNQVNRV